MIQPMRSADGRTTYAFSIPLITSLAEMDEATRDDAISTIAGDWVSENEGYNSLDYDRMTEAIEEALSVAVSDHLDIQAMFA